MSNERRDEPRPVHRTEIDGVPVFWVDTPARLHAELVFGVGLADETMLTTGVTHLVEHLVMRQLGELPHAANAGVGVGTTSFEASSSPPVVAEHLRRLCRALAEPDMGQLDIERRVIDAEEHANGMSPVDWWPLMMRYGNRGPGLVGNRALAPHRLGPAEVESWCRRWFHRGNAALVLNGPPPAGLVLPLPDGPPVHRASFAAMDLPTPAWTRGPSEDALMALMGTWSAELAVGLSVLSTRLTRRLRHEAGFVYDLGLGVTHLPGGVVTVGVGMETAEEQVPTAVERMLDTLDELCDAGPDAAELKHDREALRECLDDPDVAGEGAMGAAVEQLIGIPRDTHRERILDGVEAADVAEALQELRRSLVVGLPEGHRLQRLPRMPDCLVPPVAGRPMRRAWFGSDAPRGAQLVLGAEGITLALGEGDPMTVLFTDVVAVGVQPSSSGREGDELYIVMSGHGDVIPLEAGDWRDGRAAIEALRAAVPADLFYEVPQRWRLGGQ